MLKKLFILTSLLISGATYAAEASNNIAVVNTDKIKNNTKAGQSIAKQLEALEKAFKEKATKLAQEFDNKKQELDKQKSLLSKEAFAAKEAEFSAKLAESRKSLQQEAQKLQQMQQNALAEFNALARSVIEEVVKEGKYLHVFPSEVMIYADSKSDVTDKVVTGIDKKTDKIVVKEVAAK
jgi:Skp family chaperone for outer membrane proteins